MSLVDDLERMAEIARAYAAEDEVVGAVIPAEPIADARVFLCALTTADGRTWLCLDASGQPVTDRGLLHDAVTIAALCELAEESAAGGDVAELRRRLAELARSEGIEIDAAVPAALDALEATLAAPPRVASPAYLDAVGAAARHLEQVLGEIAASPFAEAMKQGSVAVEGLVAEVEASYRLPLA